MKHILPILTITTLAAAASAQTAAAAPAGLSYNRAGLSYDTDSLSNGYSVTVEAFVGSSNFQILGTSDLDADGDQSVSLGYVFKNVAAGIDATVSAGSNDTYGITLRRSLNEVVAGLEARIVYTRDNSDNGFTYELAYNVNAKYQVAVSVDKASGFSSATSLTVRYNF